MRQLEKVTPGQTRWVQRQGAASETARPLRPFMVWYTLVLAAVLVAATLYGLFADRAYRVMPGIRENFPDVMRGQDLLTLLVVPILMWAAVRARRGSFPAHLLWLGILLYVAYSYVIYAVSPFNDAFLLYVAAIGLSTYGLLVGLFRIDMASVEPAFVGAPRRAAGWFLMAVALLFAAMWLAMIVPAIPGGLPKGRIVYDIASTVHVLDLSLILPLLVIAGLFLISGRTGGPVLAAILLCKMVTLGLALLFMNAFAGSLASGETVLWASVTAIALAWLVTGARKMRPVTPDWLRSSLWPAVRGTSAHE